MAAPGKKPSARSSRPRTEKEPRRSDRNAERGLVTSLDKGLLILAELAGSEDPLSIGMLAKATSVNRTTAYRLCRALERGGWIQRRSGSGSTTELGPGPRLFGISVLINSKYDNDARLRPIIDNLADELQDTVHVGVMQGNEVLHVARASPSGGVLALTARLGGTELAHVTALGKAVLSTLGESEILKLYPKEKLPVRTPNSIARRSDLLRELEETRRRRFAVDDEEAGIGVKCVGAPVFDPSGRALFAISVTTSVARLENRLPLVADAVVAAASRLGESFGAVPPPLWDAAKTPPPAPVSKRR